MKSTKIVATIGPASWSEQKLVELYNAGVNIARLNFSHKDYEEKKMVADLIHRLNSEGKTQLTLMLDTKGPEIRTGQLTAPLVYEAGEVFKLTINPDHQNEGKTLFCDYEYLIDGIAVGDTIKIESGLFDVIVESIGDDYVMVKATAPATIKSYRHINLPGITLQLPGVTDQDKEDVLFGIEHKFDVIAMSFVRSAENIQEMRDFLDTNGGQSIRIIAKIENQQGIDNIEEIVEASDGIMIARGDLGIEVPVEKLPVYQEMIMETCMELGKPVITATQMIESMMKEPFPTRAEINDIYTSVRQGTDCVMLSGETAIGSYPIQAVEYMAKTVIEAEKQCDHDHGDVVEGGLHLAEMIHADHVYITGLGDDREMINRIRAYKCCVPIYVHVTDANLIKSTGWFGGVYCVTQHTHTGFGVHIAYGDETVITIK